MAWRSQVEVRVHDAFDIDQAEDLDALLEEARRGRVGSRSRARTRTRARALVSQPRAFAVLHKTPFNFTFLLATQSQVITVHRALPLPPYYHYWFGLRAHALQIVRGGFTASFWNTLPSSEGPEEFTDSTPFQTLSVSDLDTAPRLKRTTDSFEGPYCKVTLTASQSAVSGVALYAELSLVVYARPS